MERNTKTESSKMTKISKLAPEATVELLLDPEVGCELSSHMAWDLEKAGFGDLEVDGNNTATLSLERFTQIENKLEELGLL